MSSLADKLAVLELSGNALQSLPGALRHAAARLAARQADARWVLLVSDGQPPDGDVHDPQYRVADARHAVQQAQRRGVRVACLHLARHPRPERLRIIGRDQVQALGGLDDLLRARGRLLG